MAFLANAIRNYFGDGSEFGVHDGLRHRGDRRSAPPARCATRWSTSTSAFLVISGDVLTDIDLTEIVDFHDERGAMATIGLAAVENPLEFGIVITHEDGTIERFLEKPTWGQVFSDTINTGIFVLEPEIFDYIAPTTSPSTSPARCSRSCSSDGKPLYGAVADGYWEDVGTLDAYLSAHKDVLDEQGAGRHPRLRARATACWLGEGAEVHPDAEGRGPAVIGDNCRIEAGRATRRVHRARRQRARARRRRPRAHASCTTTPTWARACACAAPSSGGRATCATACASRRASVLGDECFVGEDAARRRGRQGLPVQDGRGRRHRQLLDRLGVAGAPAACSAATASPGWPTSTSRPSSRAKVAMAYGTLAQEGHDGHHVARLQPRRPACSSGR